MVPAVWVGAVAVAVGVLVALAIPAHRRVTSARLELPATVGMFGESALAPEPARIDR
jgi:hypothetical protein